MIKAEIVAHSLSPQGDELISVLCTFPRIILAEVNTHRMLSKNTSSSRAIPFEKMVEAVQNNPFIPIAWQKEHKGMQGSEYFTDNETIKEYNDYWLMAKDEAVLMANVLDYASVTKQLCNRLLESYMWTTMLITGSREGWDNFFNLRCPVYTLSDYNEYDDLIDSVTYKSKKDIIERMPNWYIRKDDQKRFGKFPKEMSDLEWLQLNKGQAEIHIMALAECIWDSVNESTPKALKAGEWHIPFENKIGYNLVNGSSISVEEVIKVKISTAMAAHTSYTTVGNESVKSIEKWIELHDKLIAYDPPHSSPMEHCARVMNNVEYNTFTKGKGEAVRINGMSFNNYTNKEKGWCYNLKGFIPYRYMIDNKINL